MRHPACISAIALLAACAHGPPPSFPVAAADADLAVLAGEWTGDYRADSPAGRSGTILFRLEGGQGEATGDVLMHVDGMDVVGGLPHQGDAWVRVPHDRVLTITFVQATGGSLFGRLDPYPDPVCGSETHTTFSGRLEGDRITGTYVSTHVQGGAVTTGTWTVKRRG